MKTSGSYEYIFEKTKAMEPEMRFKDGMDFNEWRVKAKAKLEELLALSTFEKCDDEFKITERKQCDGYEQIAFEFQSELNYIVKGYFLLPDNIDAPKPTAICLQGHSTGMHVSVGISKFDCDDEDIAAGLDIGLRALKEGCCVVVIDQRYMGIAGQNEKGDPACISKFDAMPTLLLGRCAIGERVWDIERLIDVLEKYFAEYVDMERLICMGGSGGGTATFYASCIDERIKVAVPTCAVCSFEDSIMAMFHCLCNFVPGIRKYFDMGDIGMIRAPQKLIVVCGNVDPVFPLHGVEKSYDIIKKAYEITGNPDDCQLVVGNGGHSRYPDDTWPVIHRMIGK